MSKAKASQAHYAERDREIVSLRRAGAPSSDIAQKFGLSPSAITHIINRKLAEAVRLRDVEVDLLRQAEIDRLDQVQLAAWPQAMEGHIDSLKVVMNAIDRRCRLLGLDAPQQLEVISIGAIEAEIRRVESQLSRQPQFVAAEAVDAEVVPDNSNPDDSDSNSEQLAIEAPDDSA